MLTFRAPRAKPSRNTLLRTSNTLAAITRPRSTAPSRYPERSQISLRTSSLASCARSYDSPAPRVFFLYQRGVEKGIFAVPKGHSGSVKLTKPEKSTEKKPKSTKKKAEGGSGTPVKKAKATKGKVTKAKPKTTKAKVAKKSTSAKSSAGTKKKAPAKARVPKKSAAGRKEAKAA
ncbi:MAG: hypothetical protein BJ554DRAFT_1418 [Olpidium bornovanus]|uniref:Histone H1 n=1 Tax=Olpidium bornovanus TaxID=278681 RepID=A0A8H8DH39_9FUNG|nr:MAG: hypothetical protein BJ554DRAFT_1418 [Olpidium bornovanus]